MFWNSIQFMIHKRTERIFLTKNIQGERDEKYTSEEDIFKSRV